MSRRSRESSSAGSDRVIQEPLPPTYLAATAEESTPISSRAALPHAVPDDADVDNALPSKPEHRTDATSSVNKTVKSVIHAEVNVRAWDTLSVHAPGTEERRISESSVLERSTLDVSKLSSSRRGSLTPSAHPCSPRPGSRSSRRSTRGSSRRRKSSKESTRRGELLKELARHDSVKSKDSRKSARGDSMRERAGSSRRRKDSDISSSSASAATASGPGGPASSKARRGYMTAHEAVEMGEVLCGCVLRDRLIYFLKPLVILSVGIILTAGGIVLTVLHFVYEETIPVDDQQPPDKNPPYFTWGSVTLSAGLVLFMVGLVWIPIKEQKWKDGTASPMRIALDKRMSEQLRQEIQMKDLGGFKMTGSVERIDETSLVTTQPKSLYEGERDTTPEV